MHVDSLKQKQTNKQTNKPGQKFELSQERLYRFNLSKITAYSKNKANILEKKNKTESSLYNLTFILFTTWSKIT
jgi:hypothetical protein